MNMYKTTSGRVVHEGQLTDSFHIKIGVGQGCLLSLFPFFLTIDWHMKKTTKGGRNDIQWTAWTHLDELDFADDLALLFHSHEQMQAKILNLNSPSELLGLRIHPAKSKVLREGTPQGEQIKVKDKAQEDVESFCYPRSRIDQL